MNTIKYFLQIRSYCYFMFLPAVYGSFFNLPLSLLLLELLSFTRETDVLPHKLSIEQGPRKGKFK